VPELVLVPELVVPVLVVAPELVVPEPPLPPPELDPQAGSASAAERKSERSTRRGFVVGIRRSYASATGLSSRS
jgi:hypothetical protein